MHVCVRACVGVSIDGCMCMCVCVGGWEMSMYAIVSALMYLLHLCFASVVCTYPIAAVGVSSFCWGLK